MYNVSIMDTEVRDRKAEGFEIMEIELDKVARGTELLLGAVKGFRRDLILTLESHPKYLSATFSGFIQGIAVPPMQDGNSFGPLREMITLLEGTIEGEILVKKTTGFLLDDRQKLMADLSGTHENLLAISDMGKALFEIIKNACKEFDMFNGNNMGSKTREADIMFDRDSLNISMETARAIAERAVRIDIDLMAHINELKENE